VEVKRLQAVGRIRLEAGHRYPIVVEYEGAGSEFCLAWRRSDLDTVAHAADTARGADVAIVFAGWAGEIEGEERDRASLSLPPEQTQVIQAVAAANPNTIVVLHGGAQVVMGDWLDAVEGVVMAWYFGQEGGNAIADLVLGKVNPSGKLPLTFVLQWEDHSAYGNYPGENGAVRYEEGVFVGYRHADKHEIEPLFPFGFGLSYTTFEFEDLQLSKPAMKNSETVTASITITNTGDVAGAEVAQLYIEDLESSIDRPVKELKGFQRVELEPGESRQLAFQISSEDLSFYSETANGWLAEPGRFRLHLGNSSRDASLSATLKLK